MIGSAKAAAKGTAYRQEKCLFLADVQRMAKLFDTTTTQPARVIVYDSEGQDNQESATSPYDMSVVQPEDHEDLLYGFFLLM